jgi:hypothetical protein
VRGRARRASRSTAASSGTAAPRAPRSLARASPRALARHRAAARPLRRAQVRGFFTGADWAEVVGDYEDAVRGDIAAAARRLEQIDGVLIGRIAVDIAATALVNHQARRRPTARLGSFVAST